MTLSVRSIEYIQLGSVLVALRRMTSTVPVPNLLRLSSILDVVDMTDEFYYRCKGLAMTRILTC